MGLPHLLLGIFMHPLFEGHLYIFDWWNHRKLNPTVKYSNLVAIF